MPLVTVLWDHVRQCAGGRRRRLPAAPSRELPATPGAVRDLFSLVAQDRPTRFEYRLTRELWSVMMTLMQWGDRYYGAPDRQHCQAPEAPTGPKSSQNDLFVARGNVNAPVERPPRRQGRHEGAAAELDPEELGVPGDRGRRCFVSGPRAVSRAGPAAA